MGFSPQRDDLAELQPPARQHKGLNSGAIKISQAFQKLKFQQI